jgi:co-chaperonin GroES (HSP10)
LKKLRPLGHHIIVKVKPVEETTASGIIMHSANELQRERGGRDIGVIESFGPTAYQGFEGCTGPDDWGVKIGDTVEFNRYDGKVPRLAEEHEEFKDFRIINDNDLLAVLENCDE